MRRTSCYLLTFLINFLLAVSHSGSCTPSAAASLGFLFTWNALPELLPQFWLVATLQAPPSAVPLVSVQGLWHSKLWHTQHAVLCNNNDTPYSYCLLCLIDYDYDYDYIMAHKGGARTEPTLAPWAEILEPGPSEVNVSAISPLGPEEKVSKIRPCHSSPNNDKSK